MPWRAWSKVASASFSDAYNASGSVISLSVHVEYITLAWCSPNHCNVAFIQVLKKKSNIKRGWTCQLNSWNRIKARSKLQNFAVIGDIWRPCSHLAVHHSTPTQSVLAWYFKSLQLMLRYLRLQRLDILARTWSPQRLKIWMWERIVQVRKYKTTTHQPTDRNFLK